MRMVSIALNPDLPAAVRQYLRARLSNRRYLHSELAASFSAGLAIRYGLDQDKAFLAGLAHDAARELPGEAILSLADGSGFPLTEEERANPILAHGKAAAAILRETFGIGDPDLLEAVVCHTTGAPGMGALARVVFCADYLTPGRSYVSDGFRSALTALPLDRMTCRVTAAMIAYNLTRGKRISGATTALYSELCGQ
jgi:predicted HD superfamily hydrolase involved in NAD metabolism